MVRRSHALASFLMPVKNPHSQVISQITESEGAVSWNLHLADILMPTTCEKKFLHQALRASIFSYPGPDSGATSDLSALLLPPCMGLGVGSKQMAHSNRVCIESGDWLQWYGQGFKTPSKHGVVPSVKQRWRAVITARKGS